MTSTSESTPPSPRVRAVAVVTHGRIDVQGPVERVFAVAEGEGVRVVEDPREADLVVALGGDGTILRTLGKLLGSGVPVLGVNFGRVGFLASIRPDDLERDLARVFHGGYRSVPLPTLEVATDGDRHVAVNDVVVTSST